MGEKHEQKILKAIEDYRRIAGRFLLDTAEMQAQKILEHLAGLSGSREGDAGGFAATRARNSGRSRHSGDRAVRAAMMLSGSS